MVVPKQSRHPTGLHSRNLGSIRQDPITVEWNKNLSYYVSTCDIQIFKVFTDLSKDLPFAYVSLTTSNTSFRIWLGPKNTSSFHVPGMKFFDTTGEYKNETECRNPGPAHDDGKLYRKETNFLNSWMNMRKYTITSIMTFLVTTTTTRMILSMCELRCPPKVYTLPRRCPETNGRKRVLSQFLLLRRMRSPQP